MRIILAGAYGHLGMALLKKLIPLGHEIICMDNQEKDLPEFREKYSFVKIDCLSKDTLRGSFSDADVLISTIGRTKRDPEKPAQDLDFLGNKNLLDVALITGVHKFMYVSYYGAGENSSVPGFKEKNQFENLLRDSGLKYTIVSPTPFYSNIADIFIPYVRKGVVPIVDADKNKTQFSLNPIDENDVADFLISKLDEDSDGTYALGGSETYTHAEIAKIFASEMNVSYRLKHYSLKKVDNMIKKAHHDLDGNEDNLRYLKWLFTNNVVSLNVYGAHSFKAYADSLFSKERLEAAIKRTQAIPLEQH